MNAERRLPSGIPAFIALTRRELIRFVRQPSRIVAALGTPLLFWVFLGSGFARTLAAPEAGDYAAYLVPGMASLAVIFSSIFAAISLIEDRHEGFLQSVLVSPAPRWSIVGAKIAGATIVAAVQGALLLLAAPLLLGAPTGAWGFALAMGALACIAAGISALGLALSWRIDSVQGFHGVMNLVLMPMWLLSGAIFPLAGAAEWLRFVMLANPLFWPTAALRSGLLSAPNDTPLPDAAVWLLTLGFGAAGLGLAWWTMAREGGRGRGAREAAP